MIASNIKFLTGWAATVLITVSLGFIFSPNTPWPEAYASPIEYLVDFGLSLSVIEISQAVLLILALVVFGALARREYKELPG